MQELLMQIADDLSEATALRKEGDGLRKDALDAEANSNSAEAKELRDEALKVYQQGADRLQQAVTRSASARAALPSAPLAKGSPAALLVSALVELHGMAGGLYQRLGNRERALGSYRDGAVLETAYSLASTYNRLNAVKLELLNGTRTLAEMTPEISDLAHHIQSSLDDDKSLGDGGWIYADLGDCLALLGRPGEAGRAYATFVAKAGVKLPERALDVLKEVAQALRLKDDADVSRVELAIETLTGRVGATP